MFLTQWQVERWHFTNNRYWTAWTTTTTTLASSWGLVSCIDSATGTATNATTWMQVPVENEKFNIFIYSTGTNVGTSTWQFVSWVSWATWSKIFRYSISWLTNVWTTFCRAESVIWAWTATIITDNLRYLFPVKPSTKYKMTIRFKLTSWTTVWTSPWVVFALDEIGATWTRTATSSASWAVYSTVTDWTYETMVFTTNASSAFVNWAFYMRSWNGTLDIDYNAWTLEEVVEPVANSLTSSSPSLVSFTAVGSTDNIDQSQLSFTNNLSFSNVAQYQAQQFTPAKSKLTWVELYKYSNVLSPTGTMTFSIVNDSTDNPWTTVYATYTYSNAAWLALTSSAVFTVPLPCNLVAWTKYWLKMSYSVSSATDYPRMWALNWATAYTWWIYKYGTDWVTYGATFAWDAYFKTLYYKPTTNFKASQNNSTVSISADEDGFLNTSKYDLTTWTYNFTHTNDTTLLIWSIYSSVPNLYSYSTTTTWVTSDSLYRSWNTVSLKWAASGTVVGTYKIYMGNLSSIRWTWCVRYAMAEYSYDNSAWNTINDNRSTTTEIAVDTTITKSWNYIYLRFTSWTAANSSYIGSTTNPFIITWVIDTSSLSTLRNYPTNKDIIKNYQTTLWSPTTSATYRATKWGFPAIEYSATEYQFLDINTTATGSTVAFSELWTSYTTVADWASLTITSTSTPSIFVKANITANRLYLSSNDYVASSDKDGSLKQSVVYQVIQ